MAIGVSEGFRDPCFGRGGRRRGVAPLGVESRVDRFVGTLLQPPAAPALSTACLAWGRRRRRRRGRGRRRRRGRRSGRRGGCGRCFHVKLWLRQRRDEDLGELAPLVVLPDGLALLGHLDEVDVLVVVGPRGEGAVHRGLEVAALDERHEPEVLVELVYQRVAQLRVPLPRDPAPEPGPVRSILGLGPEVAQLLLNVGGVCVVQPVELPCDVVDLAAVARLREGHPARDAHSQWQHCRWRPTHFP
mmetsp:Transcript_20041/g.50701  ORF Transcript_20041/g.50701 Transcript_20041/m.50701 type:complete len:245 (-) Transcript_20041:27-761(-)